MKLTIGNRASYLKVKEGKVHKTKELGDSNVYVDYDEDGDVLGIELLSEVKVEYYDDYEEK